MTPSKSLKRSKLLHSKIKKLNRAQVSYAVGQYREGWRAAVYRLRTSVWRLALSLRTVFSALKGVSL